MKIYIIFFLLIHTLRAGDYNPGIFIARVMTPELEESDEAKFKELQQRFRKLSPNFVDEKGIFKPDILENVASGESIEEELIQEIRNLSIEEKRILAKKGLWRDPNHFAKYNKPDTPDKVRRWLRDSTDNDREKVIQKVNLPVVPGK